VFCVAVGNVKGMGEEFWYWVLNVSSVTGIHVGGWWFEYQQWQIITSALRLVT
jgi:hypothetical protein